MDQKHWHYNGKALIIAEIGLNHNGDYDLAVRLIKEAAKAGADAVKFQNWKTEDFIFDRSLLFTYTSQGKQITEPMWDLCKRYELPEEWLSPLKALSDELGIRFLSTPTSEAGVNDLLRIGVTMIKNGSDYLSHLPLLKYMGGTGATVVISTGMADKTDVQDAVDAVRAGGQSPIVLLHCTSSYPTSPDNVNLNRMVALRETFGVPVGFSDHTVGSGAAVQAVALGACMFEKHYTLDHDLPGPDHWFSVTPLELKQYVDDIRMAEQRMGDKTVAPAEVEKVTGKEFRLSLIASRDLVAGTTFKHQDFVIAKPGTGISPREMDRAIGRKLVSNVSRGTPITWECLE